MRITIQSDSETPDLFKGLELMTMSAFVKLADIKVDEAGSEIIIPMKRRLYERMRSLLLGERYKLISNDLIDSRLIIRNVVDHNVDDNLNLPEIQILFGVIISNKELYLCSVEEQSGVIAYQMSIQVKTYDIELIDAGTQA